MIIFRFSDWFAVQPPGLSSAGERPPLFSAPTSQQTWRSARRCAPLTSAAAIPERKRRPAQLLPPLFDRLVDAQYAPAARRDPPASQQSDRPHGQPAEKSAMVAVDSAAFLQLRFCGAGRRFSDGPPPFHGGLSVRSQSAARHAFHVLFISVIQPVLECSDGRFDGGDSGGISGQERSRRSVTERRWACRESGSGLRWIQWFRVGTRACIRRELF